MKKIFFIFSFLLFCTSCVISQNPFESLNTNTPESPSGESGTSLDKRPFYVSSAPVESQNPASTNNQSRQIKVTFSKNLDTTTFITQNIVLRDISVNPGEMHWEEAQGYPPGARISILRRDESGRVRMTELFGIDCLEQLEKRFETAI